MQVLIELTDKEKEMVDYSHKAMFIDVYNMMANKIKNGKLIPDNATNGDVIKMMFPNIITEELTVTMHASTKVTCCGDKHCEGTLSYDFWKEWWNAPYK